VPDLLDLLSDRKGRDVSDFTCRALQRIGLQPEAVPALCKALKHMDHHRWERPAHGASTNVVDLLGNLGPAAKDSIPALARCLEERKSILPIFRALGSMGLTSKAALPGMLKAIEHAGVLEYSSTQSDEDSTKLVKTGRRAAEGVGLVEAPRGTLFHHYRVNADDQITMANLIVSTTNNNEPMNRAVHWVAMNVLSEKPEITEGMLNRVEVAIRAYDPCLSCATHALGAMPLEVSLVGPDGRVLQRKVR
jgi:hypothetical protein